MRKFVGGIILGIIVGTGATWAQGGAMVVAPNGLPVYFLDVKGVLAADAADRTMYVAGVIDGLRTVVALWEYHNKPGQGDARNNITMMANLRRKAECLSIGSRLATPAALADDIWQTQKDDASTTTGAPGSRPAAFALIMNACDDITPTTAPPAGK
jgi:hypothetical protein